MPGENANDTVERINGKEFIPRFEGGNWFMNRKGICLTMIQICVTRWIYVIHCSMVVISSIEINCNMATCLCGATPWPIGLQKMVSITTTNARIMEYLTTAFTTPQHAASTFSIWLMQSLCQSETDTKSRS
jgi:hypothetical protein